MKRNTKHIGDISEAKVLSALIEAGYRVAIPFGEDQRHDLVVDYDGQLLRVQVKTGRLRAGVILFNAYSSHSHRNGSHSRTYHGDADLFAVFCSGTGAVYLAAGGSHTWYPPSGCDEERPTSEDSLGRALSAHRPLYGKGSRFAVRARSIVVRFAVVAQW